MHREQEEHQGLEELMFLGLEEEVVALSHLEDSPLVSILNQL